MADETREALGTWVRRCKGYEMRRAPGDDGRLVRLERVWRWLMAGDDGLPYEDAGEAILQPLEALGAEGVAPWLYVAGDGGYAHAVQASDGFPSIPPMFLEERRGDPKEQGAPGALRRMRAVWCKSPGQGQTWFYSEVLDGLAVPVAKAHELWGWGEAPAVLDPHALGTFDNLVKYRKQPDPAPWDVGEQRAILAAEVERLGGPGAVGAVKAVADALGITVRAVNTQLKAYKPAPKLAPGASVFSLHGKATGS